ncbi:sugar phosphate nucleotidyltransferase [Domibacillus enclensis]|uniref:Mannose-1-phosphate guanylyltransferase n=1 Tax=Domibacillus enclensis TaxID=1017273 RepID=A0A1N6RQE4_9BACI|nr:sugar phosphate nucleotidyltransferase [Domibacillus enclensis]OXS79120.1 mannose-1-phosphate guanylyltransferase [Domibacillus enclensis]SIQ31027.1 mannose-1-phosphate guanylyltransferase [Domibacillus enclensis]
MKLVLLSGGSGKRLWPLSNDTRSKQFLKVLEGNHGDKQSMVQRVWSQLEEEGLAEACVIATSKLQRDMIHAQVGEETPLIIEPERRDTFPAIALAASYLHSVVKMDEEEAVAILPVDPYVENAFFSRVRELEGVLDRSGADLALIGVAPTYPSSKYGYIIPEEAKLGEEFYKVSCFTEKPSEEEAQLLIEQNAFWNCGVFAFKLGYVLDILRAKQWPVEYEALLAMYAELPKISFDYEVVEKAAHIAVLPHEGYWKDLGTWNTLTEEMATTQIGKGVLSKDSVNTHLVNELDIPVTVIGTTDIVVAASPDGILVADKASSPKIKELISAFDHPPMYEERLWGWSRTLDYAKYEDGEEMVTKRICILKGKNSTYHYHNLRDEVWTIVRGEGELALDDSLVRVKAGDIVHLPAGKKHGIRAIKELEFIEVQTGSGISDEDFFRLYFEWGDVIKHINQSEPRIFT